MTPAQRVLAIRKMTGKSKRTVKRTRRTKRIKLADVRHDSRDIRNHFTKTLTDHGASGTCIGNCTRVLTKILLGSTSKDLRRILHVGSDGSVRDKLGRTPLAMIQLAESLASDKIEFESRLGDEACLDAVETIARNLKSAVDVIRVTPSNQEN